MTARRVVWLAAVFFIAVALSNPALASTWAEGEPGPPWLRFLGRLHPLLVHFPIALIVTAGALEFWKLLRGKEGICSIAYGCIRIGALSALAAAAAGWILADNEPHGRAVESAILWHRWTGVATLALAAIASLAGAAAKRGIGRRFYRGTLFAAVVAVGGAGHLGGELVRGEDYLFEVFRAAEPAATEPSVDSLFTRTVAPILEKHCISCHGPDKRKGKLRLDSRAEALKGDRSTWLIIAGNAAESELFRRVTLPPDDFDIMPAEGDVLSAAEVEALRHWIDSGAEWPE